MFLHMLVHSYDFAELLREIFHIGQSAIAHNLSAGHFCVEFGHSFPFSHGVSLRVLHLPPIIQRCVRHLTFQIEHFNEFENGSEDRNIDESIICFER